jgi:trans-aconitate 2-methyltransferase
MPHSWDGATYHQISTPQQGWGLKVLDRLPLRGDETVLDAGCGSGHVTAALLERLPGGRVIALDSSPGMLAQARETLARFGDRVTFLEADLQTFRLAAPVDAVFSTATLHWVRDHFKLFQHIHDALLPGGRLVVQLGGERNLQRVRGDLYRAMKLPEVAPYFESWAEPWTFPDVDSTLYRLRSQSFVDHKLWIDEAPTVLEDEATYRRFLRSAVLVAHMDHLAGKPEVQDRIVDFLVERASRYTPPWSLDYRRLNIDARKQGGDRPPQSG